MLVAARVNPMPFMSFPLLSLSLSLFIQSQFCAAKVVYCYSCNLPGPQGGGKGVIKLEIKEAQRMVYTGGFLGENRKGSWRVTKISQISYINVASSVGGKRRGLS